MVYCYDKAAKISILNGPISYAGGPILFFYNILALKCIFTKHNLKKKTCHNNNAWLKICLVYRSESFLTMSF